MNLDSFMFGNIKYNRAENNTFESEILLSNKIIKSEELLKNRLEKSIFIFQMGKEICVVKPTKKDYRHLCHLITPKFVIGK